MIEKIPFGGIRFSYKLDGTHIKKLIYRESLIRQQQQKKNELINYIQEKN